MFNAVVNDAGCGHYIQTKTYGRFIKTTFWVEETLKWLFTTKTQNLVFVRSLYHHLLFTICSIYSTYSIREKVNSLTVL